MIPRERVEILADEDFYGDMRKIHRFDPQISTDLWTQLKVSLRYVDDWESNVVFSSPPRSRHFKVKGTGRYAVRGLKLRKDRILLLSARYENGLFETGEQLWGSSSAN